MSWEYGKLATEVYDLDKPLGHSFGDVEYYTRLLAEVSGRILEPATGTGRILIPLLEAGHEVDGLDSWVAIAVATDDQWQQLSTALGSPSWATDPTLSSVAGRSAHEDMIDERLAAWCCHRTGDDIAKGLARRGGRAGSNRCDRCVMNRLQGGLLPRIERHEGLIGCFDNRRGFGSARGRRGDDV